MAALSAIAAYDVSDAESGDEINESKEKATIVDLDFENDSKDLSNPDDQALTIKEQQDSYELIQDDADVDDDDDDDNDSNYNIIPTNGKQIVDIDIDDENSHNEDDDSMNIPEEEKDLNIMDSISEPVKIKFKRYSCDSAMALAVKLKAMTEDLHLPPEPDGRCSKQLQDKMKRLYEKKIKEGENLNQKVQARKDFRNPSIYDKLILYLGIEERGTNFSKNDFDPSAWRKVPDYEDLARAQREDVAKREREKKTKVEFVTGTVKKHQV